MLSVTAAPNEESSGLFPFRLEALNLIFPLLFALPVLWEVLSSHRLILGERKAILFVTKIFFLNHVHIYFTLALILFSPQIRTWFIEQRNRDHFFYLRLLIIFAFFFAFTAWGLTWIKGYAGGQFVFNSVMTLVIVVGLQHLYAQTLGLSLGYNRKFENSGKLTTEEQLRIRRLEVVERRAAKAMMASNFLYLFALQLFPEQTKLSYLFIAGSFAAAFALQVVAFRYPKEYKSKKIFMLRYWYFPVIPFAFFASIAVQSIHGIEYLCVFHRMQSQSIKNNAFSARRIWMLSLLLITFLTAFGLFNNRYTVEPFFTSYPNLMLYCGAFAMANTYLHYHIDGLMFRMKDGAVRSFVAPLLFGSSSAR